MATPYPSSLTRCRASIRILPSLRKVNVFGSGVCSPGSRNVTYQTSRRTNCMRTRWFASASQPEGSQGVDGHDEAGRSVAPASAHPTPLAQSALRRQIPKVEAGCGKAACPVLCGGACSNTRPYRDPNLPMRDRGETSRGLTPADWWCCFVPPASPKSMNRRCPIQAFFWLAWGCSADAASLPALRSLRAAVHLGFRRQTNLAL
jgi:hypothetical protein